MYISNVITIRETLKVTILKQSFILSVTLCILLLIFLFRVEKVIFIRTKLLFRKSQSSSIEEMTKKVYALQTESNEC